MARTGSPRGHHVDRPPPAEPEEAAAFAGLRYVNDAGPGIHRRRRGRGFAYVAPNGEAITDPERLEWIRSIAIPPVFRAALEQYRADCAARSERSVG